MIRRMCHIAVALVIGAASSAALSSCASINVNSLPQPGNAYSGGYDIVIEFGSVLNLPDHAKVTLDGTNVGVVTNVALKDRRVDVTARIDPSAVVPSNARAALQQATVLGDVTVAVEPAEGQAAPPLKPGGTIPLAQTTTPPQLEDTIASMANFVSSGSIQRVQNTILGLNRVTPSDPAAVRAMASRVAVDLSGLSDNMDNVDRLLDGAAGTAQVLNNRSGQIAHWFTPQGMLGFDRVTEDVTVAIATGIPRVGSFYSEGYYLAPFLNSLADALGTLQHSKWAFEKEYPAYQGLLTDVFLPADKYPAINITSIVGPDGRELSGNVQDVLRILGVSP
jgi:phospholipid/cholesterol/gamma-HCH transport system substrate-binding protein